ncbi:MAG: sel1 repeat family protein, partial [Nitrospira sp.]|nr:sel1 repeat family protein [Nitrospira sp.]
MYKKGEGVKQNLAEAADWYRKACDGGDAWGCANLGLMYKKGTGVKQDFFQAGEVFRKAC